MTLKIRGMWVYLPTVSNNDTEEEQENMGKKNENSDVRCAGKFKNLFA